MHFLNKNEYFSFSQFNLFYMKKSVDEVDAKSHTNELFFPYSWGQDKESER